MAVLVTGGAGYIGSHIVHALRDAGTTAVVVDDLSGGDAARVAGVPLLRADLADPRAVPTVAGFMAEHAVDAVVHMAALKRVEESVTDPARYYQQNVGATAHVLMAMDVAGVRDVVFSSSAAVYGETTAAPVREGDPTRPLNPYGATKLAAEDLLRWAATARRVDATALRYFNVAGAARPLLADTSPTGLVPTLVGQLRAGRAPTVFGDDYATPDGTCVRDYVHVEDVAAAHVVALRRARQPGFRVFNIGTGTGTSVLGMIDALQSVSGVHLTPLVRPRRPGDPAVVVASVEAFTRATGWTARRTIDDMIRSSLAAAVGTSPVGSSA